LQASNQKTPSDDEKSRAALMCLWAHSVSMLFSGIGVPLIRIFQNVAPFFEDLNE
jgi:L-lactate permease